MLSAHHLRAPAVLLVLFSTLGALLLLSRQSAHAQTTNQTPQLFDYEVQTMALINQERRQAGAPPLRWNRELTNAARWFAWDAVENHSAGFCDHTDSQGGSPGDRMRKFGYTHMNGWAENAVCGYSSPAIVVRAWMNSESHRVNLLNPAFREMGVGYYRSAAGRGYVVLDLSNDPDFAPAIINDEAAYTTTSQVKLYIYDQAYNGADATGLVHVGPTQAMQISNNPDFAGAQWEPYVTEKAWTLEAGSGWRTVYVKTRDAAGRTTLLNDVIYIGQQEPADQLTLDHASAYLDSFTLPVLPNNGYRSISFSLSWLVDNGDSMVQLIYGRGERVPDSAATSGTGYRLFGAGSSQLSITSNAWSGGTPTVAYFRLKVSDNSGGNELIRISVLDGIQEVGHLSLRGQDFAAAGAYQEFAVPFAMAAGSSSSMLTLQLTRAATGGADVFWDNAALMTAPQAAAAPLTWKAPGAYYRSHGVQARFSNPDGTISPAIDVYPWSGQIDPAPTLTPAPTPTPAPSAPQIIAQPTSIWLTTADPATPPSTASVTVQCQNCGQAAWSANATQTWLTVAQVGSQLNVGANTNGLAEGVYQGQIELTGAGVPEVAIPVTLLVGDAAVLLTQRVYLPVTVRN